MHQLQKSKYSEEYIYNCILAATASLQAKLKIAVIKCPKCNHDHLDEQWYAINTHKKHLCSNCKEKFLASDIGNPLATYNVYLENGLLAIPIDSHI